MIFRKLSFTGVEPNDNVHENECNHDWMGVRLIVQLDTKQPPHLSQFIIWLPRAIDEVYF